MRLFTAIDLAPNVLASIQALLEKLRPTARIQWSPLENLHVTTKFIGFWPEERLEELKAALSAVPRPGPIDICVRKLGFFPNPHAPRVFWAGVEAAPELAVLAADTDRLTASLGVESEKRPFSPHLTLARIKEPAALQRLRETIAALDSLEFGAFQADRFYLYLSQMHPRGSVYTKLAEFPLTS